MLEKYFALIFLRWQLCEVFCIGWSPDRYGLYHSRSFSHDHYLPSLNNQDIFPCHLILFSKLLLLFVLHPLPLLFISPMKATDAEDVSDLGSPHNRKSRNGRLRDCGVHITRSPPSFQIKGSLLLKKYRIRGLSTTIQNQQVVFFELPFTPNLTFFLFIAPLIRNRHSLENSFLINFRSVHLRVISRTFQHPSVFIYLLSARHDNLAACMNMKK